MSNGKQRGESKQDDVRADRDQPPHRKVSAAAQSRKTLAARHDSSDAYARFTVDAAFDIYDGEPIDAFKAVNVMDANHQRKLELEFKRQVFAQMMETKTRPALVG